MAKIKLTGKRSNFSGRLGKGESASVINRLEFVNGVAHLPGNYDNHKGIVAMVCKFHGGEYIPDTGATHGASQVHNPAAQAGAGTEAPASGGVQPVKSQPAASAADDGGGDDGGKAGAEGSLPPRDGHSHSGLHSKVKGALAHLDHNDNEHWTQDGQPSVSAVEGLVGEAGVTRAIINEVAPDLRRKK